LLHRERPSVDALCFLLDHGDLLRLAPPDPRNLAKLIKLGLRPVPRDSCQPQRSNVIGGRGKTVLPEERFETQKGSGGSGKTEPKRNFLTGPGAYSKKERGGLGRNPESSLRAKVETDEGTGKEP